MEYDLIANKYHLYRQNESESFWNNYIDYPCILSLISKDVFNKIVLDLGCGTGIFTKKILSLGPKELIGIDSSNEMIKIAKRENPNISFVEMNALKTLFKNDYFDLISSNLSIHYIKELDDLFKEMNRILKKEGTLIFSMSHPISDILDFDYTINKFIIKDYFNNNNIKMNFFNNIETNFFHHTFEEIVNYLINNGFQIERLIEPLPDKSTEYINPQKYWRTTHYPSILVVKAKKKYKL